MLHLLSCSKCFVCLCLFQHRPVCFLAGANKSYVVATSDLWLFIHASNLLSSTPHPAPLHVFVLFFSFPKVIWKGGGGEGMHCTNLVWTIYIYTRQRDICFLLSKVNNQSHLISNLSHSAKWEQICVMSVTALTPEDTTVLFPFLVK